ncbi:unnamed protein product [Lampetra planeri]
MLQSTSGETVIPAARLDFFFRMLARSLPATRSLFELKSNEVTSRRAGERAAPRLHDALVGRCRGRQEEIGRCPREDNGHGICGHEFCSS